MDTDLLVDERIDDGRKLIVALLREEFDVTVAFWVRTEGGGSWLLYISSKAVDEKKVAEAYRKVFSAIKNSGAAWVFPSEIKLIHPSNLISVAAVMARDRVPSGAVGIRYGGKKLGPLAVEEVYIYPRERWFKGFDTIKKNFPSAQIFTVPVLSKDVFSASIHSLSGRVNSTPFEGRAPETVFFLGPQGGSGNALGELIFVHRPEGWNTLFRAETNSWEEVVHQESGRKLYESADFGPLEALKTQQKMAARELGFIKQLMSDGNHYLLLPGDSTPIYKIPYTPPSKLDEEPHGPIDWEDIRYIMEAGGKIEVFAIPKSEKSSTSV